MSTESIVGSLSDVRNEFVPAEAFANPSGAGHIAHPFGLSRWSQSPARRAFDIIAVTATLPLLLPALAVIAVAIRLTSRGPAFFFQKRIGRNGKPFTIVKFRTMAGPERNSIARIDDKHITPLGRLLRRWKLDEFPQCLNVLRGDMSLVGPRPKLPEHQVAIFPCRPGITGAATLAFAREEIQFASIPRAQLDDYYRLTVLPTKHRLDAEYMAGATFASDLALLAATVLRRWNRNGQQLPPSRC